MFRKEKVVSGVLFLDVVPEDKAPGSNGDLSIGLAVVSSSGTGILVERFEGFEGFVGEF